MLECLRVGQRRIGLVLKPFGTQLARKQIVVDGLCLVHTCSLDAYAHPWMLKQVVGIDVEDGSGVGT